MPGNTRLLSSSIRLLRRSPGEWRILQRQWHRRLSLHTPKVRRMLLPSHLRSQQRFHSSTWSTASRTSSYIYGTLTVLVLGFGYLYITDTRASIHQWLVVPTLRILHSDPEDAHHAGIRYIKGLHDLNLHPRERGEHDKKLGDLQVEVLGHTLDNAIGTSAGIDKNAEIPDALFALGPAIVEVGGATPLPQEGNAKPRVFRIPSQNALINRYGLNSEGAEHVAMQLRERVRQFAYDNGLGIEAESERIVLDGEAQVPPGSLMPGKLLAVQIAKNKTTPDNDIAAVVRDYVTCVDHLAKYADILVVNVSSPNTPGLRDLQATAPLTAILSAVVDAAKATPRKTRPAVMVKVSPDEDSDAQIEGIASAVWAAGIDGVIVGNTTKKRPDSLPRGYVLPAKEEKLLMEMGGFSGPQMFERTLALVKRYRAKLGQGQMEDDPALRQPPVDAKSATPSSTRSTAIPAPSDTELSPKDASVQRDLKHLKPLTPEADKASKQPIVKLPERHSTSNLESSGQALEPASVDSIATAVAPPPSSTVSTSSSQTLPAEPIKPLPAPYPSIGPITAPPTIPEHQASSSSTLSKPSKPSAVQAPNFEPKVIFATGGITNGEQCLQILNAGASVCQVYTAMMYGGVGTITRMKQEMRDSMKKSQRRAGN